MPADAAIRPTCQTLKRTFPATGKNSAHTSTAAITGSDTGNLIATLPGTLPGIVVLTCHMDCVPPCCGVEPLITDGLIHTDGSTVLGGDDKVGDAAILECMRSLAESGQPHVTVKGIFTVQAEVG